MKLHLRFALFTLIALTVSSVFAVQRQVVCIEGFTQWNCPPCANWNPQERTVLHAMTRDTVISVKYHAWWPGANNDAMHLWNVSENTSRINYYGVNGVPTTKCDGSTTVSQSQAALRNAVRTRYGTSSPGTIDDLVASEAGETSVSFSCMVTAESDMTNSNLRIFAVLITDEIHYSSPPGTNGETMFDDVFRDMWPNSSGQTISLEAGQQIEVTGNLNKNAAWSSDSLSVVVFIQNTSTRAIQQTAWVEVTRPYGFNTNTDSPAQMVIQPNDGEQMYEISLDNIGLNDETYEVELSGTLPAGWTRSIEADGINPDANMISVPLAGNNTSTNLVARLNPNGNSGSATLTVTVTSPNSPNQMSTQHTFRLMSGLDVLLVDDDIGSTYETYYEAALAPFAQTYVIGRWDVSLGSLDVSYFENIDLVVWFTGNDWFDGQTISALDQSYLEEYLNNGGRLFVSGQGIGFDCRTDGFFSDYLHATFNRNHNGTNIAGVDGDPISNGMSFSIVDGDGADNQTRQSAISAHDDQAAVFLEYAGSPYHAALRIDNPTYKVVYLGFGFEAIATPDARMALMANSVNWLMGTSSAEEPSTASPREFALGQNYPNPFNPETVVPYSLPVRSDVSLKVYDITGREVATLFSGVQDAGNYTANWNAVKFSSGVYFYRLEASNGAQSFKSTQKLVLLK